jgi:NADH-quinone oxidoreductase subunit J
LLFIVGAWTIGVSSPKSVASPIPPLNQVSNTEAIGLVLYTKYVYFFELAGMVLLVSMIGAIVLTLQHRARVRRQSISAQNARTAAGAVELRKVRPGQGVDA